MTAIRQFVAIGAAALVFAFAPLASAEVVEKTDTGFVVREAVEVPTDQWTAWSALTAPAKWWNPAHTWSGKAENLYIDSQATGCFCELMQVPEGAPEGTRRGSVEHMHIVYSYPGSMLRLKGGLGPLQSEAVNGTMTIKFKVLAKGTRISLEYVVGGYMRMKAEDLAPLVDQVLSEQMARLGKLLGAVPVAADAPAKDAGGAKPAEGGDTKGASGS